MNTKQAAMKLRLSPMAWAKLMYLRDLGSTEIGGFGISQRDDFLFIEDIQLVPQQCSWSSVKFDDNAVADYFEGQVEAGRHPTEFARIWVHTHPGSSADPSPTDEATLARVFGRTDWAIMLIVARDGQTYARLRCNVGPGADVSLSVEVDYTRPFNGSDIEAWKTEYTNCVRREVMLDPAALLSLRSSRKTSADEWWRDAWDEYADFETLTHKEQFDYAGDI